MRDLLELNPTSWKSEGLSAETQQFIRQHRHQATTATAGFALFWLARNSLLFGQDHPDLISLHYADLVDHPQAALSLLSKHIDLDLDPRYAEFPQRRERRKELPDPIPPVLLEACEDMMARLKARSASLAGN
ncbi:MAG: hypothetical protein U0984_01140 [Prosthecobacter sp.]|nr:hypothetical protein [Prosthecobacter sp.]